MKHQLQEWQIKHILDNCHNKTAVQLSVSIRTSVVEVNMFCEENNIELTKAKPSIRQTYYTKEKKKLGRPAGPKEEVKPPPIEREKGRYDNLQSPYGIFTKMQQEAGLV